MLIALRTYLTDVSGDEAFTPPERPSAMLDPLPQDLFPRLGTTFLVPARKSGGFLRGIARRLNAGLWDRVPDSRTEINYVLTKQSSGWRLQCRPGYRNGNEPN